MNGCLERYFSRLVIFQDFGHLLARLYKLNFTVITVFCTICLLRNHILVYLKLSYVHITAFWEVPSLHRQTGKWNHFGMMPNRFAYCVTSLLVCI